MDELISRRDAIVLAMGALPCASALLALHPDEASAASPDPLEAALICADSAASASAEVEPEVEPETEVAGKVSVSLGYRAYVRKTGWQSWRSIGKVAGTTGKARALGGIAMKAKVKGITGSVTYRAHLSGTGWQDWKKAGAFAGSKKRNLEAVRIKLTGKLSKSYDVYYRAHIAGYGWLDWAKNGAVAGSVGQAAQMEALQVRLLKKGATFPGKTATPAIKDRWTGVEFWYRDVSHVKQILEVKYVGGSYAWVHLREKRKSGWRTTLSCRGYVGSLGIGKAREGDARTPEGDFGITSAFGINGNPGARLPYVQVDSSMYWCGDSEYYNQLIDINECPHYCTGEHLIDYRPHYNYGLFIDYNTNPVVYGAGSAIFIHCAGDSVATEGCIAVSQSDMIRIIRRVSSGARVCIYPM